MGAEEMGGNARESCRTARAEERAARVFGFPRCPRRDISARYLFSLKHVFSITIQNFKSRKADLSDTYTSTCEVKPHSTPLRFSISPSIVKFVRAEGLRFRNAWVHLNVNPTFIPLRSKRLFFYKCPSRQLEIAAHRGPPLLLRLPSHSPASIRSLQAFSYCEITCLHPEFGVSSHRSDLTGEK